MNKRFIKASIVATAMAVGSVYVHAAPIVGNASFETPVVTQDTYTTSFGTLNGATDFLPWRFGASSGASYDGVVINSGVLGASGIPDGTQAAFLQGTGSISQPISGFASDTYTVSFEAEARPGGGNPIAVTIDGIQVAVTATPGATFTTFTSLPFTVAAGTHTLGLAGTIPFGTLDRTSFVDLVSINAVPEPATLGIASIAAIGALARRRRS